MGSWDYRSEQDPQRSGPHGADIIPALGTDDDELNKDGKFLSPVTQGIFTEGYYTPGWDPAADTVHQIPALLMLPVQSTGKGQKPS